MKPIVQYCLLMPLCITTTFVINAQAPKKDRQVILSIAWFIESANNSINALGGLLKKDNYRNKISSLNNPANSELGFNLKNETLDALEPILGKTKKTDHRKFSAVIGNLLSTPEESGLATVAKYLPAVNLFSTVLSLVGNLAISEKKITNEDLNKFIVRSRQYFLQYERLNSINEQFAEQVESLLKNTDEARDDLKGFLIECISSINNIISKESLEQMPVDLLAQKYFDPQKMQVWLDTAKINTGGPAFPPDAATSIKALTASLKRLQKDFESTYTTNYKALKELTLSLKNIIPDLNQEQLTETNNEIDRLYNDSRQADVLTLNITRLDERMGIACRTINLN